MTDRKTAIDSLLEAGELEHKIELLIAEMVLEENNPGIIAKVAAEIRARADNMVPPIVKELLGQRSAA